MSQARDHNRLKCCHRCCLVLFRLEGAYRQNCNIRKEDKTWEWRENIQHYKMPCQSLEKPNIFMG